MSDLPQMRFDEAWMEFLDIFVAWKTEDAASLETELVRVAVKMERSLRSKLASGASGGRARAVEDLEAMREQVGNEGEGGG